MTANPTAVTGRRIGAWVIDLLIYLALAFLVSQALGIKSETRSLSSGDAATVYCDEWKASHSNGVCLPSGSNTDGTAFTIENSARSGVFFVLHLLTYAVIQGVLGGSLGKLAVGLRVVDSQGKQAGVGKSLLRTVLWIVDAITCGLPILGGILMLSTKDHRRIGDMAAGTYVVDKGDVGRPPTSAPSYGQGYGVGQGGWAPAVGSPTAWDQTPGSAGSWSPSTPSVASPAGASSTVTGDGPQWDSARNAYIQYDRELSAWLQWNDSAGQWRPIDQ